MPKLTVDGVGSFEVPADKRLVNALTDDAKIDQMHACGGFAGCTTCRVEFVSGEPAKMTQAEKDVLIRKNLLKPGIRLSCQILCDHDMSVKAISRVSTTGATKGAGNRPADQIEPDPVWISK